jgi:hypothetical protein
MTCETTIAVLAVQQNTHTRFSLFSLSLSLLDLLLLLLLLLLPSLLCNYIFCCNPYQAAMTERENYLDSKNLQINANSQGLKCKPFIESLSLSLLLSLLLSIQLF